jgi:hypothetical protein
VTRLQIILIGAAAAVAALVAESYIGSTRYEINGVTYGVPHKYEFMRNFNLPWLAGVKGLDREPDQSVWLLFPAKQLTQGILGYSRWFHGYADQIEADMVVNVLGGKEAREFPGDRRDDMKKVAQELAKKSPTKPDPMRGWDRVYWLVGEKGTPGQGNDLFYLIPHSGVEHLPIDWRVPSCQSSPDISGRETYNCLLTIYRDGRTFGFYIRHENLGVANRIPDYVAARLNEWRT